ncbi:MAG TPA: ABC transporter permease [Acidimicrobiales bacterium]|nr:ABC transporter permease [Acidimicrobiales bacterium]
MTGTGIHGRKVGFGRHLLSVAGRAVRRIPREPESVVPAIVVPVFFYAVNLGALSKVAQHSTPINFKDFLLPGAIVFAVTGVSRASTLVTDIERGYFDRLMLTPVPRLALLLGLMAADFLLVVALTIPVIVMGLIVGVRFASGPGGVIVFILISALWGLAFTGFLYAIALKTGNPAAVNAAFVVFFPFAFLTTAFVPKVALSSWMSTVADYNPVTYLLAGLRSLESPGWQVSQLLPCLAAIACVFAISMTLALSALRGRTSPD